MNKRQLLIDLFPFCAHLSDDELDQFVDDLQGRATVDHVIQRWRGLAEDYSLGYRPNLEWSAAANAGGMTTVGDMLCERPVNRAADRHILPSGRIAERR